MRRGMVFDIQRFSVSDGPGVRTTVFLKGCNLRCLWCHNPESQNAKQELQIQEKSCIHCGACIGNCEKGALYVTGEGKYELNRALCDGCGACTAVCCTKAVSLTGRRMIAEEVLHEVKKDLEMYRISGGGMTVSGGEPLLQPAFTEELLRMAKACGIHTAVETAGDVSYEHLSKIAGFTDLFLYDIKGYDAEGHRKNTGRTNGRILENLKKLSERSHVFVRMPVIAGKNDSPEEIRKTSKFLRDLVGVEQIEVLPYHRFGEGKYECYGRRAECFQAPTDEQLEMLAGILKETGKKVIVRSA